ncbi:MAG: hypothetical protein WC323_01130 [Patescibacteria group bacterium]|jgi:3D (Asp-Asp-Asp) domain-containing protein
MKFYQNFIEKFIKKPIFVEKQQKLFKFSNEAFVIGKKLKIAKKIAFILISTIIFSAGILTPVFADETVASSENEILDEIVVITTENGAVLSEIDTELVKEGLKMLENRAVSEEGFIILGAETSPPYLNYLAADNYEFVDWGVRTITSYNSEAGQTDGSPCTTANMFNVCEHGIEDTIAANFLKFGTKVRIPELFGNRIFVVRDRMNPRYPDGVDVWMLDKAESKSFGVRRARIEVVVEKEAEPIINN